MIGPELSPITMHSHGSCPVDGVEVAQLNQEYGFIHFPVPAIEKIKCVLVRVE